MHLHSTEIRELNSWIQQHVAVKHLAQWEEGVDISVTEASGGGIGSRILATCSLCKEEKDVTDYSRW